MTLSSPKGTYDILPQESDPELIWRASHLWQHIETKINELSELYCYREIRTPLFERTELFQRGVGDSSDIVSKEMYTFLDKAGRSMSLRPEMTASVMRAFIEKKLHLQSNFHKLFYVGPMFRYDRPQAGRYRQFFQFGAEAIGSAAPEQDVEIIDLLYTLFQQLGLKNLTLHLNSVGDATCRTDFSNALKDFLLPHTDKLSEDSQRRLQSNPLRILDSKEACDQDVLKTGAPSLADYLNDTSRKHLDEVRLLLEKLNISYFINPKLVRGLDYYNKTVFEITAGELGAQNTIGAGGRYDGLLKTLGGPDLPAVGFATGMERLLQTMIAQKIPMPDPKRPKVLFIALGEAAKRFATKELQTLRHHGIAADMEYSEKKLKDKLRYADQLGAQYTLIIGDNELAENKGELKDMKSRTAQTVTLSNFIEHIQKETHV